MTTRDGRPYDPGVWLHEAQAPEDHQAAPPAPPATPRRKSEARRKADIKARQTQGDRRDWRYRLLPLPKGYRLAPEDTLAQPPKAARTRSIQRVIEKRKTRKGTKRSNRHAFRDPITEALHYGVRLDPEAVQRDREQREDGVTRQHYYPDERCPRIYAHEVELDRLCDWFLVAMTGADPVIMSGLEFKEAQRPAEIAAWLWTGEFPEIRARVEAKLAGVTPPPRTERVSLR